VLNANASNQIQLSPIFVPFEVHYNRIYLPLYFSNASNSSGTMGINGLIGFYSQVNGTQIEQITSFSNSVQLTYAGNDASSGSRRGIRHLVIDMGGDFTLNAGSYVAGVLVRSTISSHGGTVSYLGQSRVNSLFSGEFNAATATSRQLIPWLGRVTAPNTLYAAGLASTVALNAVTGNSSAFQRGHLFYLTRTT
jgi:hypothetical protein